MGKTSGWEMVEKRINVASDGERIGIIGKVPSGWIADRWRGELSQLGSMTDINIDPPELTLESLQSAFDLMDSALEKSVKCAICKNSIHKTDRHSVGYNVTDIGDGVMMCTPVCEIHARRGANNEQD